ncbi:SAM-dependent methyltransferase [Saccharothrix tamanrassetensis]|uniref:SAM-dependent methyltransferase n=1 Tax=Saccharothrix tamanrassetensis TaxID=1051531 RepID=A0A841CE62_9PSEU|nr:methyltransferase domain-containing protein [Saccharothrix tamanrassetensis]MBB5954315.1 SAM-dependent methyltransferase [Saccharothrix tamanrassetensis]
MSDLPETFDEVFLVSERSEWLRRAFPPLLDADLPPEVEPFSFVPMSGLEEIASAVRPGPGGRLVDVACGRGGPGMWVARRVGATLCGVDGSPVAVASASRRRDAFGLGSTARFVVGDLADTGLDKGMADAVMCVDAFQFTEDRDRAARELRRVLRPGGRLVLTCWEARTPGDVDVAERFATLRCDQVLRDAGFTDVDVAERPAWEQRRQAVYEAALDAGPSDDPGLTLMQAEARTALAGMPSVRRVLVTATNPTRTDGS